ncbi:MAG: patatin-like phospholipase family protein [Azospirillaceae bacterium]|nr:patatin-like phospholipase family protein [Azospirillaceae bacterium]
MTYRILSLSGGGTWALIEAMALDRLYPGQSGRAILKQFDLATGSSGGAIVLGALLCDFTAAQIVDLFRDAKQRARLYVPTSLEIASWSAAAKLAGLAAIMGPTGGLTMRALAGVTPCRIVIPTFDTGSRRAVIWRSYDSPIATGTDDASLVEVINASSMAPITYFDGPAVINRLKLWDGGIAGDNTPALLGLREAVALGAVDVAVLSLGSGGTWRPVGPARQGEDEAVFQPDPDLSVLGATKLITTAVIDDPPDAATLTTHVLTRGRCVVLNPMLRPVRDGEAWVLPAGYAGLGGIKGFRRLVDLGMDATAQSDVALIADWAAQWLAGAVPNQAVLADPVTGARLIGHVSFAEAAAAWAGLSREPPAV